MGHLQPILRYRGRVYNPLPSLLVQKTEGLATDPLGALETIHSVVSPDPRPEDRAIKDVRFKRKPHHTSRPELRPVSEQVLCDLLVPE